MNPARSGSPRRWLAALLAAAAFVPLALAPSLAHAVAGPAPGAASANTLKLPDGPGSVQGLADSADVQLFSAELDYAVPLELPAAPAGLSPHLELVYSGELGHGPVGVGWRLTSASIRRTVRDGVPGYTASDALEIVGLGGGGDLVALAGGEYRVLGKGQRLRVAPLPDGGFVATDGDGRRFFLGESAAARMTADDGRVAEWFVERVVDLAGQEIRFGYRHDQGQVYLDTIDWGPADAFRTELVYEPRPDVVASWRTGFLVVTAQRLREVRVRSFGQLARTYHVSYDDGFSLSRVAGVRMTGRGGAGSLPPLAFTYAHTETASVQPVGGVDGWVLNQRGTSFLDVDSDGLVDLVRLEPNNHQYRRNLGGHFAAPRPLTGFTGVGLAGVRLVDIDGDAHAEMVRVVSDTWRQYRLVDDVWQSVGALAGTFGVPLTGTTSVLIDVNGDHRTDVLRATGGGNRLHLAGAGGLAPPRNVGVIDPNAPSVVPGGANVRFFDVNGDGLDDAIYLTTGWLQIFLGRGDGTFALSRQLDYPWGQTPNLADLQLADLNRDGLMDLVRFTAGHVRWYRGRADGSVVTTPNEVARPEGADADVGVAIVDANGNGSQDVVWSSPRGMWLLDLAGTTTAGMLVGIDNGMGRTQRFDYTASSALMFEDEAAGRPWQFELPIALPVPTRHETRVGPTDPPRVVRYRVRDGFWDVAEHRFGGFLEGEQLIAGKSPAETLRITTRHEAGVGAGRVLRGEVTWRRYEDGAGRLLQTHVNQLAAAAITGLGPDPRLRVPVITREAVLQHEGVSTPIEVVTEFELDGEGRPRIERQLGRLDLTGDERVFERTYASDAVTGVRDRLCEERLYDATGRLAGHTRTLYGDDLQELAPGVIGKGWVRRREALLFDAPGEPAPRWITQEWFRYSPVGEVVAEHQGGVTRAIDYDARGLHPVRETVWPQDGEALSWTMTWDDVLGAPATHGDPSGVTTHMHRDPLGRLTGLSLGDASPYVVYEYDWERARPRTTTWRWDGPLATVPAEAGWRPGGGWRQTVSVVDGGGAQLYSATRLDDARWIVSDWKELDDQGRVAFIGDPFYWSGDDLPTARPAGVLGQVVRYDALDRPVEEILPTGARRRFRQDGMTETTTVDDLGPTTSETDGHDRVIRAQRSVAGVLERAEASYDAGGRLTRLSLEGGAVEHRFSYDSLGRLVEARDADIGVRRFRYDDASRLIELENGTGQRTRWEYDGAGRVTRRLGDAGQDVVYHYDFAAGGAAGEHTLGRLAWVEEPDGAAHLGYDLGGRPAHLRRTILGVTASEHATYAASGLLLATASDDGFTIATEYDAAGRPRRVGGDLWEALETDADGTVLVARHRNGVVERVERDELGQAARLSVSRDGATIFDVAIAVNAYGAPVQIVDQDGVGLDHGASYAYDDAGRLTDATLGAAGAAQYRFRYAYDGLQNMTSRELEGPRALPVLTGSYHYGERGQGPRQLSRVSGPAGDALFDYDDAGRLVADRERRMSYDGLDQLLRVEGLPGAGVVEHTYGYDGQRSSTRLPGGELERFFTGNLAERRGRREHVVMSDGRVLARVDVPLTGAGGGAGVVGAEVGERDVRVALALGLAAAALLLLARLVRRDRASRPRRATASVVLLTLAAAACSGGGSGAEVPAAQRAALTAARVLHYHYGPGAGPAVITRADGSVFEERRHEPFGAPVDAFREAEGGAGGGSVGDIDYGEEPLGAMGKPTDAATGWSYHGARWMAADTGRWLTPDPPTKAPDAAFMERPWDLHPYQYVRQNPVVYDDPDGRNPRLVAKYGEKALKWLATRGTRSIGQHVIKFHIAKTYAHKSHWAVRGIRRIVERTLKNPHEITDQGGRIVFERQFKRAVGNEGRTIVRVVVEKSTGEIVTTFTAHVFKRAEQGGMRSLAAIGASADQAREQMAQYQADRARAQPTQKQRIIEQIADFVLPIGVSEMGDEDAYVAESRILNQAVRKAINEVQQIEGRTLSPTGQAEVRDMVQDLYYGAADEAPMEDGPDDLD